MTGGRPRLRCTALDDERHCSNGLDRFAGLHPHLPRSRVEMARALIVVSRAEFDPDD